MQLSQAAVCAVILDEIAVWDWGVLQGIVWGTLRGALELSLGGCLVSDC